MKAYLIIVLFFFIAQLVAANSKRALPPRSCIGANRLNDLFKYRAINDVAVNAAIRNGITIYSKSGIGISTPVNKLMVAGNENFMNRVGIGTSYPASVFDVNGQLTIDQKSFGG